MTVGSTVQPRGDAIILVVERDPHVQELEAFFLERAGYAVEFARDGLHGLDLVQTLRPDIVVTEILVPRLDGLSLCRRVKQSEDLAGTSILIFSILAAHDRAKEAGADAFLMKPLAEQKLVDTVRQLLAQREGSNT